MPALSKILVPVDFSGRCGDACRYAGALACRFDAELTLLHVFVPMWSAYAAPEGYAAPPQIQLDTCLKRLHARMDDFVSGDLRGIKVRREIFDGDPARSIAEFAQKEKTDLIVMPTHGYGPFRRFLLGSVTAKVLHDACCPVFTGPHLERPPAFGTPAFGRILCALDLGPQSRAVLQWAAWFAGEWAGSLEIVHVAAGPNAGAAADCLAELEREFGTGGTVRIVSGEVSAAVREAAAEYGADVLVIGRGHAHGLFHRLRTNAYAILRESPCPVVAI
jgi:nucleotide-binding universal stress UspA family protein